MICRAKEGVGEMKDYIVTYNTKGTQSFLVKAKSKAESIRKVRALRGGLQGDVVEVDFRITDVYWSTAKATLDAEPDYIRRLPF